MLFLWVKSDLKGDVPVKKSDYHVYDALKILIKISKNAQDYAQEFFGDMSPMSWVKEFCTIRASTARRGGHTEAVFRLIKEDNMNIGYFSPFHSMLDDFNCRYNQEKELSGNLEFSSNIKNIANCSLRGLSEKQFPNLDAIIVDNSFMLSKKEKSEIYNLSSVFAHPKYRLYGNTHKYFYLIFLQ